MIKMVSPRKLYPTVSLTSIEENKILFYVECIKDGIMIEGIEAFLFKDNYFILRGHHKMLAANRLQLPEVLVDIVELPHNTIWDDSNNIIENIRAIGMTALYDFEAVGGFTYEDYSFFYNEGVLK